MGLLLKLKDGDTKFKSLRYGNDRPGGGDSGQPYIRTAIPGTPSKPDLELGISDDVDKFFVNTKKDLSKLKKTAKKAPLDNVIRGGLMSPILAFRDVERLSAYFFSTKNPSGLIFAAKQNALSRIAPKTEATTGLAYGLGTINGGIYTPLSTIAQAGVGFLGTHLNKQGLDPTGAIMFLDINKYGERAYRNNQSKNNILKPPTKGQERRASRKQTRAKNKIDKADTLINKAKKESRLRNKADKLDERADILRGGKGNFKNRLLKIWADKQDIPTPAIGNGIIRQYSGGPGSYLGIGKTKIKFATTNDGKTPSRTGVNKFDPYISGKTKVGYKEYGALWTETPGGINYRSKNILSKSVSKEYIDSIYNTPFNPFSYDSSLVYNAYKRPNYYSFSNLLPYAYNDLDNENTKGEFQPWDEIDTRTAITQGGKKNQTIPKTFTQSQINQKTQKSFYRFTEQEDKFLHPSYKRTRQEEIIGFNPNKFPKIRHESRVNIGEPGKVGGSYEIIQDKINASRVNDPRLFSGSNNRSELNDFVQFRIKIIKGTTGGSTLGGDRMKFRAYIDSMSDSFSSKWNSINYMGVGETFKKYQGFDRSLSLGFTVAALSQAEMFGMYEKLKFLANSIMPTYSDVGYMTGNLIELTIGDWCKDQPGILESFTYDIPQEAPWELKVGSGQYVNGEVPMMIKVTGFKFFPIYNFRPDYGEDNYFFGKSISPVNPLSATPMSGISGSVGLGASLNSTSTPQVANNLLGPYNDNIILNV